MKSSYNFSIGVVMTMFAAGIVALGLTTGYIPFSSGLVHAQPNPSTHASTPTIQKPKSAQVSPAAAPTAPAAPSPPVRTERIVYDSWTVTCTDTLEKASKKTCSASLQVVEEKQRQVLMLWIIGRDNQGVLRTVIQGPTGVQIPKGLELKLGAAAARTIPYASCSPQNCEASIAMDDAMVRDARASGEATATIFAIDGRAINFKMGIKGIDKAFAALGK